MVLEDGGQLIHRQVSNSRTNGLEGGVIGYESGDVLSRVKSTDKVGVGQRTRRSAEASSNSGCGDVERNSQDRVDNMKHTPGKVDVLIRC